MLLGFLLGFLCGLGFGGFVSLVLGGLLVDARLHQLRRLVHGSEPRFLRCQILAGLLSDNAQPSRTIGRVADIVIGCDRLLRPEGIGKIRKQRCIVQLLLTGFGKFFSGFILRFRLALRSFDAADRALAGGQLATALTVAPYHPSTHRRNHNQNHNQCRDHRDRFLRNPTSMRLIRRKILSHLRQIDRPAILVEITLRSGQNRNRNRLHVLQRSGIGCRQRRSAIGAEIAAVVRSAAMRAKIVSCHRFPLLRTLSSLSQDGHDEARSSHQSLRVEMYGRMAAATPLTGMV